MTDSLSTFRAHLLSAYTDLLQYDPAYALAGARTTPTDLADRMVQALANGTANIEGEGIRRACRAVGIRQTRKAIRDYLTG
jgi:hypothetical protein